MDKIKKITKVVKEEFEKFINDIKNIKEIGIKEFLKNQKLILGLSLALVSFSVVAIISSNTSQLELYKDLEVALKQNKPSIVSSKVLFEDEKIKIHNLKPLTTYYSENTALVDMMIKELKANSKSGIFTLKSKKQLWRDTYYLELNPVDIKIESNFQPNTVLLNEKEIKTKGITRGIVPGVYTITAKLNTNYGIVESSKELILLQDETIKLPFDATLLTIASNFNDASVYINGISADLTVEGVKNFGPIPSNKSIEVFLEKDFPWGKVKSEPYEITDVTLLNIPLNGMNEKCKKDIQITMDSFFISIFEALNTGDLNIINSCNEDAKNSIYEEFKTKSWFLKDNYEMSDLSTVIQESELVEVDGVYKSKIEVKINYNVYKKILPFIKTDKEGYFILDLIFKDNQWLVEGVQNIGY